MKIVIDIPQEIYEMCVLNITKSIILEVPIMLSVLLLHMVCHCR